LGGGKGKKKGNPNTPLVPYCNFRRTLAEGELQSTLSQTKASEEGRGGEKIDYFLREKKRGALLLRVGALSEDHRGKDKLPGWHSFYAARQRRKKNVEKKGLLPCDTGRVFSLHPLPRARARLSIKGGKKCRIISSERKRGKTRSHFYSRKRSETTSDIFF